MKNLFLILAIGSIAVILLYFFLKKIRTKIFQTKKNIQSHAYNAYNKKNQPRNNLTLEEKIELSWKFLYEITEIIFNKFSQRDKELINEIGRILYKQGMRYQHVTDFNAISQIDRVKSNDLEQEKSEVGQRR